MVRRPLHAYRCDIDPNYWHIGHLPEAVQTGDLARAALTSKPEKRTT